ncbi:MAG: U32 family peptidase [Oscillospiraceae bacterium]|nr:U32 family peptidase [Oscillospiraceae bacterium]
MEAKAELLSPAGDLERLKMAILYGADAIYLAGRQFGMRSAAANFSDDELRTAVSLAHEEGVKIYVTCNTLPREKELRALPAYLEFLQDAGVDALIIADLGVLELAKLHAPRVARHVSTQFGVINSATANALFRLGADTVVLARETPLEDIRKIRDNTPPELRIEAFVHGAMCVSFSGRCLLSNYLTGRDANRGQCAQPCRWKYHLVEETRPGQYFEITEDGGTYILNSRDMRMIEHLPELLEAGVTSLKIEGRMKSAYYTAVTTNAYRHALDAALAGESLDPLWVSETEKCSHRPYTTGFYFDEPGQHYAEASYSSTAEIAAVVQNCGEDRMALLTQRNKIFPGDALELLLPEGEPISFTAGELFDEEGNTIPDTRRAMMRFRMRLPADAPSLAIVRKLIRVEEGKK